MEDKEKRICTECKHEHAEGVACGTGDCKCNK